MQLVDRLGGDLPRGPVTVELDDIQATVLRYRPEPYYGTHVMLHVDDAQAGRALPRRGARDGEEDRRHDGQADDGDGEREPPPAHEARDERRPTHQGHVDGEREDAGPGRGRAEGHESHGSVGP